MRSKTVVQLILFVTSFVIIFSYIKPSYTNLQDIQSETKVYIDALESAKSFNTEIRNQLSDANKLTTTQLQKLDRYLPDDIDSIAVMRDIEIIAKRNRLSVEGLSAGEEISASADTSNTDYLDADTAQRGAPLASEMTSVAFSVKVSGQYDDLKLFLQDLEKNAYPLEVISLTLAPGASAGAEGGSTSYALSLQLETYKLSAQ